MNAKNSYFAFEISELILSQLPIFGLNFESGQKTFEPRPNVKIKETTITVDYVGMLNLHHWSIWVLCKSIHIFRTSFTQNMSKNATSFQYISSLPADSDKSQAQAIVISISKGDPSEHWLIPHSTVNKSSGKSRNRSPFYNGWLILCRNGAKDGVEFLICPYHALNCDYPVRKYDSSRGGTNSLAACMSKHEEKDIERRISIKMILEFVNNARCGSMIVQVWDAHVRILIQGGGGRDIVPYDIVLHSV